MPTLMELKLEFDEGAVPASSMGSRFQGALMERLDTGYAEALHRSELKPYSQHLVRDSHPRRALWRLGLLDPMAEEAFGAALEGLDGLLLRDGRVQVNILSKRIIRQESYEGMVAAAYGGCRPEREVVVRFATPCAFRQNGAYQAVPTLELVYQSLMNKWDACCPQLSLKDNQAMKHLADHTQVMQYQLRTAPFHLERIRITGFTGTMRMKVNGPEQLASLGRLLLGFGEYCGIGIKTAMGMGGVIIDGSTDLSGRRHRSGKE